jgi:multidrug efflux system outer membrane protein
MFRRTRDRFAALTAALLLAACSTASVGPQESGVSLPAAWNQLQASAPITADASAQVEQDWWKHFRDPTLNALIEEALANSKTLQVAKARIDEARANRGVARSALFPEVDAVGNASRSNQGFINRNQTINLGEVDLQATWEVDLFGRNQARVAEASAILESQEASSQAVRVELLAEVARNYFDMRNYERQIALTRANLGTQQKTFELTQVQLQGGFASDFDVQRAGAQVSTTAAQIPVLQAAYDAALNRLNILLGYPPGTRDEVLKTPVELQPLDQQVLIAAPATVLKTRPDVRAAERRLAASISDKDAARAELFPDISLTALFGVQGGTGFGGTPWSVGAGLLQPVLNFGRIESQIDAADARQRQNYLSYQETVLEALENMEDALSNYIRENTRNASLATSVDQNRRAADLASQQYTNGFTSLLDLLVAERDLLDAEASQAASDASLRKDLVAIYTAAGGGWSDTTSIAER